MFYDVIIVGGGPAALTAGIYAARYKLKTVIFSKNIGGVAATSPKICNYPSYPSIQGFELMQKFTEHAKILGVEIIYDEVKKITKNKLFLVKTDNGEYEARKIIYATGTKRERLEVPGEGKLQGRGVSYCSACDGPFFKNKVVAIVGGGDAALSSALLLSDYASKIYIINRKKDFSGGNSGWAEIIIKDKKIDKIFNEEVVEIIGDKNVEGIRLKSGKNLKLDGVFIEIGSVPETELLKNLKVKLDKKGFVIVDKFQKTNVSGLFSAGDVSNNVIKQVITAAGEGAIASYSAYVELKQEGKSTEV